MSHTKYNRLWRIFFCLNAYRLGIIDGWQSPDDLGGGMTWDNPQLVRCNSSYDAGANVGQHTRRLFMLRWWKDWAHTFAVTYLP